MYYVGIDISKYKHDCCILEQSGNTVVDDFVFANSSEGFETYKTLLVSLASPNEIKIGFEATGHYTSNLKQFLENAHYSFMESNPALISKFIHAQTFRKTKNDALDSLSIAHWLMTVESTFPHEKHGGLNMRGGRRFYTTRRKLLLPHLITK